MRQRLWIAYSFLVCSSAARSFAFGQSFEVASVRPAPPPDSSGRVFYGPQRGGPGTSAPGQITWTNATLRNILMVAYDVQIFQIDSPAWTATERYDIVAKVPAGASKAQVSVMWQQLLKERFGLVVHRESREFKVDVLTVAKGGAKLTKTDLPPDAEPFAPGLAPGPADKNGFPAMNGSGVIMLIMPGANGATGRMFGKGQTASDIAAKLGNAVSHPVLDQTGLTGKYDFILDYSMDITGIVFPAPPPGIAGPGPGDGPSDPGSNIHSALEKQLGLKLTTGKANLDVIVVDHVEKIPTEN